MDVKNNIGLAHYYQMLHYAKAAEEHGCYYGNKTHFQKRHDHIISFLNEAIDKLEAKKQRKDKE